MHSLSILLAWKGSETSHHLGEERQNFCASFQGILSMVPKCFPVLLMPHWSHLILFRMMINDGSNRLVVVVVVGVSVISYDAVYQQLHSARIKNERFCAFSVCFWMFCSIMVM